MQEELNLDTLLSLADLDQLSQSLHLKYCLTTIIDQTVQQLEHYPPPLRDIADVHYIIRSTANEALTTILQDHFEHAEHPASDDFEALVTIAVMCLTALCQFDLLPVQEK